jgi:ketosteroid isomerase-like protein
MTSLDDRITAWAKAELSGDAAAFNTLLHPEFLAVGPFGFLLNRAQWMERFAGGLYYTAFDFAPDTEIRIIGGTAFVVGTQTQQGDHQGRPVDGAFRATLVFTGEPEWLLAAVHLSLRTLPGQEATAPKEKLP